MQSKATKNSTGVDFFTKTLSSLKKEHEVLLRQKDSLHDLLEQGIYSKEDFLERSKIILEKLSKSQSRIEDTEKLLEQVKAKYDIPKDIIPETRKVIDIYCNTGDAAEKNALLKSILLYAEYNKSRSQREDDFEISIYPKIDKKINPYG